MKPPVDIHEKLHPWRICPIGKHLVREHPVHVPASKKHPSGFVSTWHEHCADNPSKKDVLSFDEIQAMTEKYFSDLSGPPAAGVLKEFPMADKFDKEIRGWTHYWNDIFHPLELLNPNFVKALITTESSFDPETNTVDKKRGIHARGLMQIIEETLGALGNHKGELRNHLIHLTKKNLFDPSASVCAGIRWLFRKKETASSELEREATWEETVIFLLV